MSQTLTTFLFEAANFLVLAAVLGWLFFKPIRRALADHRARIDEMAQQAKADLAAAEQMRAEVEQHRQQLRDELARLRTETLEAAREEAERIIAQARAQAHSVKEAAEKHVTRLSESETTVLSRAAATAAAAVVDRLLVQLNGAELRNSLVRAACQQLQALSLNGTPVVVESAEPLDAASRALLDQALGKAAASATYRVVSELGGGLRVTTERGLVDASIAGLADFARRSLGAELQHHAPQGTVDG